MIVELVGPKQVRVIKKGNSIFDLSFRMLSFRDALNYTGPTSLRKKVAKISLIYFKNKFFRYFVKSRFGKIFNLDVGKGLF